MEPRRGAGLRSKNTRTNWQHTPWGRILIGILVGQGLLYGARQALKGVFLGLSQGDSSLGELPEALILFQAVQLITLLVACVLAAGGQRQGIFIGALIGAWSGVLSTFLQRGPAGLETLSVTTLLGQPLIQTFFGALGGWVGCTFWKPLPPIDIPTQPTVARKGGPRTRRPPLLAGPVYPIRIACGVGLAVAGTLAAPFLFTQLVTFTGGVMAYVPTLQDTIILWEIKALALLGGGVLAGSNTPNGLKQGLFVALGTASILVGIHINTVEDWLPVAAYSLSSSLCLCLVGGWFGGQLFPPVVKISRKGGFASL